MEPTYQAEAEGIPPLEDNVTSCLSMPDSLHQSLSSPIDEPEDSANWNRWVGGGPAPHDSADPWNNMIDHPCIWSEWVGGGPQAYEMSDLVTMVAGVMNRLSSLESRLPSPVAAAQAVATAVPQPSSTPPPSPRVGAQPLFDAASPVPPKGSKKATTQRRRARRERLKNSKAPQGLWSIMKPIFDEMTSDGTNQIDDALIQRIQLIQSACTKFRQAAGDTIAKPPKSGSKADGSGGAPPKESRKGSKERQRSRSRSRERTNAAPAPLPLI